MYVEQMKDGRVRYGQRYKEYITGQTKRATIVMDRDSRNNRKLAQELLDEKIEKLANAPVVNEYMTLGELCKLYLAWQKENVKLSTYTRNKHAVSSILQILGPDVILSRLTADYIKKMFNALPDSPGTLNERAKRLKAMIRWAYQQGYMDNTTCIDRLTRWKDVPHKAKINEKFMEKQELHDLLLWMEPGERRDLTEFLTLSGLRFGEAAALLRSDIDINERYIHVTKTLDSVNRIVTTPKTYDSVRDVYIQEELLPLVSRICIGRKYNQLVFPGTADGFVHYYSYNKWLKENTMAAIGRPLTVHALRHTHTSLCAESGMDLDAISRRLGHSDSDITKEIYLHVTKQMQEQDNKSMDRVKILR